MTIEQFLSMSADARHRWWERELHANGGPHGAQHDALVEGAKGNPEAERAVHRARHGHMPEALAAFMRMNSHERTEFAYRADYAALNAIAAAIPDALPPDGDPDYQDRANGTGKYKDMPGGALRARRADPALWRERFRDALNAATHAAEQEAAKDAYAAAERARADYMRAYYAPKARPSA